MDGLGRLTNGAFAAVLFAELVTMWSEVHAVAESGVCRGNLFPHLPMTAQANCVCLPLAAAMTTLAAIILALSFVSPNSTGLTHTFFAAALYLCAVAVLAVPAFTALPSSGWL